MTPPRQGSAAPLWRRLAAICYDLLLVAALLMTLTGVTILARGGQAIDAGSFWFQLLLVCCWWLYFTWSWTHGGRTIGMRAWRLELTGSEQQDVSWGAASIRFLVAGLSTLVAGIGFLWSLIGPEYLAWHDRWSGTRLRLRPKLAQPDHGDEGDQR